MDMELISSLQGQLNHERTNVQKYLYMASGLDNMAYPGFASFFRRQAADEQKHADKICDYLISKGVMPEYHQINAVILTVGVREYATVTYQTETTTTEALQRVYNAADEAGDGQVCAIILDLLKEQIEEENTTRDFMDQIMRVDNTGWGADARRAWLDEEWQRMDDWLSAEEAREAGGRPASPFFPGSRK